MLPNGAGNLPGGLAEFRRWKRLTPVGLLAREVPSYPPMRPPLDSWLMIKVASRKQAPRF